MITKRIQKKFRKRETLNLSACADSSTDSKENCIMDSKVTKLQRYQVTKLLSYQVTTDLPLLTPPLSTVDWFQIQKSPN